jgi:hypothetical protein
LEVSLIRANNVSKINKLIAFEINFGNKISYGQIIFDLFYIKFKGWRYSSWRSTKPFQKTFPQNTNSIYFGVLILSTIQYYLYLTVGRVWEGPNPVHCSRGPLWSVPTISQVLPLYYGPASNIHGGRPRDKTLSLQGSHPQQRFVPTMDEGNPSNESNAFEGIN